MKSKLDWSNFNIYQQTTQSRMKTSQKSCMSKRRLAFSEALLDQVSRYLPMSRNDVAFTVKELASRMSKSCIYVISSLEEILGILEEDYGLLSGTSLEFPQAGEGYVKKGESYWCLETFSDSDWSGHKSHRKSTSGGFHALNSCPLFNSSRRQKIISLSSCEAEPHAIVFSSASNVISILEQYWNLLLGQRWTITSSQIHQVRANF